MKDDDEPGPCAWCGRFPAEGRALVDELWYCHGDGPRKGASLTCYERATIAGTGSVLGPFVAEFDLRRDGAVL